MLQPPAKVRFACLLDLGVRYGNDELSDLAAPRGIPFEIPELTPNPITAGDFASCRALDTELVTFML